MFLALDVDTDLEALVLLGAVEGVESETTGCPVYVQLDVPLLKVGFEPCAALIREPLELVDGQHSVPFNVGFRGMIVSWGQVENLGVIEAASE